MNKTDRKIEEQIKHIKEEHSTMGIGYHLDLLSTLIQEEINDMLDRVVVILKDAEKTIHGGGNGRRVMSQVIEKIEREKK